MSELSMADMRRIGAQRNAQAPASTSPGSRLLSRLAFSGNSGKQARKKTANQDQAPASTHVSSGPTETLSDGIAAKSGRFSARLGLLKDKETSTGGHQAAKQAMSKTKSGRQRPSRSSPDVAVSQAELTSKLTRTELSHMALGGAVGALAGAGMVGGATGFAGGAVIGGLAGKMVSERAQLDPLAERSSTALKEKQAPALFEHLRRATALVEGTASDLQVTIDQSAGVRATVRGKASRSGSARFHVVIGYAALAGLSLEQIETLSAHALVRAQISAGTGADDAKLETDTLVRTGTLAASLGQRTRLLRLTNLDHLEDLTEKAEVTWHEQQAQTLAFADAQTGRYAGANRFLDTLLAQALLAAHGINLKAGSKGYEDLLASLETGVKQPHLDAALSTLAATPKPSPAMHLFGLHHSVVERLSSVEASCPVPSLPAGDPALSHMPEKTASRLAKAMTKTKRRNTDHGHLENHQGGETEPSAAVAPQRKRAKAQAANAGLIGRLFARRPAKARALKTELAHEPLYEADALHKNDPGLGLEAYQALLAAHPRWALARLRLAEAQLELADPTCVDTLLRCAQELPSALPIILDRLTSALPMVSPLEQEPLREAADLMGRNADAIARERAEIDLDGLSANRLDAGDEATLRKLFDHAQGLREAWVFASPCLWMPEIPHHAILGLAPRMSSDDAQALSVMLAEHAAITGTVAVYLETGTPRGRLGDALASHPSLWRAGRR